MKILLGIPVYNGVHPEVVKDIVAFDIDSQVDKNDLDLFFARGSIISQNRNLIMKKALAESSDWVLMWDTDISVPDRGFFQGMVETARKFGAAVVGLPVRLRTEEHVLNFATKRQGGYINETFTLPLPEEIDVIGCGVMLINMAWIRENMPKAPWFSFVDTETGCFPEDWNFCEKVKEKGGKIVVDPRFKTVHYGEKGYE